MRTRTSEQSFNVWLRILLCIVFIFSALQLLPGQAVPTASKTSELSFYGAYAHVWPDYGTEQDNGAIFGVEYTRFLRCFLTPSLVLRGKVVAGPVADQRSWGGGIRGQRRLGNFYPYIDFLVGAGTITFTHPFIDVTGRLYESDNSVVYSLGGGVDYDFASHFAARVDYQFEHWDLGTSQSFTPNTLSVGVVYHISPHTR